MSTIITVDGMTCEHCERNVESALLEVKGVSSAVANRHDKEATIEGEADVSALLDAVESAGYAAEA